MAERINKEELRNVLVRNFEMTEEQAANVLERFFGLIIKALETDRYVKV
jgi:nucleoid DNA-binding protein